MHDGGHQPYARGPREQGTPLNRMLAGESLSMGNPMDTQRNAQRTARAATPMFQSEILAKIAAKHAAATL